MKKQVEKTAPFVKYQISDFGANPATRKGRTWIRKEIKKMGKRAQIKLRAKLENQKFSEPKEFSPYWDWVQAHGDEMYQANPDLLADGEVVNLDEWEA